MKGKVYLAVAQLLGVFAVKGLWGADSVMDFEYKKCSWPYIYSLFTLLLRLVALVWQAILLTSWAVTKISSTTDRNAASLGFACTFCSGAIYHLLIFDRTKSFVEFLKKMEQYDMKYPEETVLKMCSKFLVFNVSVTIFTVLAPLAMIGYYLIGPIVQGRSRVMTSIDNQLESIFGSNYSIILMIIFAFVLIFMESASIFPIFQLNYAVNSLELKLKNIYLALENQCTPKKKSEVELLLDIYTNGSWAEKRSLAHKVGLLKDSSIKEVAVVENSQFWKQIRERYLNFVELHQSFLTFSGLYFVTIYPTQILSAICILYINTTSWLDDASFAKSMLSSISYMGLVRIWALSSIWQETEEIRTQILYRALRFDVNSIFHEDERVEYENFLKAIKWMSIELNVGGFFNINRGNIPAIIMAAISNLIVLFQFKDSETPAVRANSANTYNAT